MYTGILLLHTLQIFGSTFFAQISGQYRKNSNNRLLHSYSVFVLARSKMMIQKRVEDGYHHGQQQGLFKLKHNFAQYYSDVDVNKHWRNRTSSYPVPFRYA